RLLQTFLTIPTSSNIPYHTMSLISSTKKEKIDQLVISIYKTEKPDQQKEFPW
ncbi:hypothetical protein MNBD_PLANCTO02-2586, partial [hydrothermal vent metagenome]